MTYEEKLKIADDYLNEEVNVSWDELEDVNSLHDAETKEDVIDLCKERLEGSSYFVEDEDIDKVEDIDMEDEDDEVEQEPQIEPVVESKLYQDCKSNSDDDDDTDTVVDLDEPVVI